MIATCSVFWEVADEQSCRNEAINLSQRLLRLVLLMKPAAVWKSECDTLNCIRAESNHVTKLGFPIVLVVAAEDELHQRGRILMLNLYS